MPRVDLNQFDRLKHNKKKRYGKIYVFVLALLLVVVVLFVNRNSSSKSVNITDRPNKSTRDPNQTADENSANRLKHFTSKEFNQLATSIKYPNTQLFETPPVITGNYQADEHIRNIAKSRGYEMSSMPLSSIIKINEPALEGDDLLQPQAASSWRSLKSLAEKQNIPISLVSAYRSPDFQRNLFLARLTALGATVDTILSGQADDAIISVLSQAAIPGFSRHHNGYTIDLGCKDGSTSFLTSSCFKWISEDNYKIAKENGWIPSYPDGVVKQGPEPEPWEYIWVGSDLVRD